MRAPSSRIAAALARQVAAGADSAQIADAVVATCEKIDAALGPIIGQGSVAVLFMRSIRLVEPAYPWLAQHVQRPLDLGALKSTLSGQDSAVAAAGGGALLHTFYEMLASLIGPVLTERMLRNVWAVPATSSKPQEVSPWP